MRCSKCGRENRAGRRFCAHCGAKLTLVCASCKAENEPGEQFCGECGEPLAEPAKPQPPPEPLSYTPKHLAEKILTSRSALEGERKQVTVLFADVKGSMELAERVDPEDWHGIMERFFQILTDGVHRFEGASFCGATPGGPASRKSRQAMASIPARAAAVFARVSQTSSGR